MRTFRFLKTGFRLCVSVIALQSSGYTQDQLSSYNNMTPEQLSAFRQLDPMVQNNLISKTREEQEKQDALDLDLKDDDISKSDIINEDAAVIDQDQSDGIVVVKEVKDESTLETETLELYGYDIFSGTNLFKPSVLMPIPVDYVLGPGDTIAIRMFGKLSSSDLLTVTREGNVVIPGVGDVNVIGLTFLEAKENLLKVIKERLIGVTASITMGELRSIRIFIMGEVAQPGSYAVNSLSTITNALFSGGGILKTGSLRNIQLKRRGELVSEMDLYDLLLKGDSSNDVRLQPGDVLFVPPIGKTATISGQVVRPAIYELKGDVTAEDLLNLAGGLTPDAYLGESHLLRVDSANHKRFVSNIDLSTSDIHMPLQNGDKLFVKSILPKVFGLVGLHGAVSQVKLMRWFEGMRVSDLIISPDDMKPNAIYEYALIKRTNPENNYISVKSTRLDQVISNPQGEWNLLLEPQDEVIVLSEENRDRVIEEIIKQLSDQRGYHQFAESISVVGNVKRSGNLPFEEGMTVLDALRGAQGLSPMTDMNYALLEHTDERTGKLTYESIELPKNYNDVHSVGNKLLKRTDKLIVFDLYSDREIFLYQIIEDIERQATQDELPRYAIIGGQVRHGGSYPIGEETRVSDLLKASGAFNASAYTLEAELTHNIIVNGRSYTVSHENIDLNAILKGDKDADLIIQPYDNLMIRPIPEWADNLTVTVEGEVYFPGSYKVKKGETLVQLVERAGGFTDQADPSGSLFLRESLRMKEQDQLDRLRARLKSNLAAASFEVSKEKNGKSAEYITVLLDQLEASEAVGRMVLDLGDIIRSEESSVDIILKDGDRLIVPQPQQEVMVLGEVLLQTSHLFKKGLDYEDYINLSGGTSSRADLKRIYVIKSNGSVVPTKSRSRWFQHQVAVEPGDSIVVPFDVDYISPLPLWKEVTSIIYNLAVSAAAVASF